MASPTKTKIDKAVESVSLLYAQWQQEHREETALPTEEIRKWVDTLNVRVQGRDPVVVRDKVYEKAILKIKEMRDKAKETESSTVTSTTPAPVPEPVILPSEEAAQDVQGDTGMGVPAQVTTEAIAQANLGTNVQGEAEEARDPDVAAASTSSARTENVGGIALDFEDMPRRYQLAGYPYVHDKTVVEKHGIPLRRRKPNEGAWTGAKRPRYPTIHRPYTNNTRAHIVGNRSRITRMHTLGYDQDIVRSHPVPPLLPPHAALSQRGAPEVVAGIRALQPGSHHWLFG